MQVTMHSYTNNIKRMLHLHVLFLPCKCKIGKTILHGTETRKLESYLRNKIFTN